MDIKLIAFIALVVLVIVDALDTYYMVRTGKAQEANPVMKWLMDVSSLPTALALSHIAIVAWLGYAYDGIPASQMILLAAIYLVIFINNFVVWKRTKAR